MVCMGLLDTIFGKKAARNDAMVKAFRTLTDYQPVFTTWSGGVYELELTRAAIHAFANGCSRLKPEVTGTSQPKLRRCLDTQPNEQMTWPQMLYRIATILECDATAFVVPELNSHGERVGLWPIKCEYAELVDYGQPWIRFHFATGDVSAIELSQVCVLTKYQYESDVFGSPNVLGATMQLLHAQNEAQENAIRSGATIRFVGQLTGQVREEDMTAKRERFSRDNLSDKNTSGLLLYDNTYKDLKQVEPYSYTIDAKEMERIRDSVYNYFGTNEEILQNKFNEDHWNSYYEGKIEPFAIQLGDGLTKMIFTRQEQIRNRVSFSSNRLQFATSASKRNMIRDMTDRGIMSINEAREILQLPPIEDDARVIRGEYADATALSSPTDDKDPEQHDQVKKDSDLHGVIDKDEME